MSITLFAEVSYALLVLSLINIIASGHTHTEFRVLMASNSLHVSLSGKLFLLRQDRDKPDIYLLVC